MERLNNYKDRAKAKIPTERPHLRSQKDGSGGHSGGIRGQVSGMIHRNKSSEEDTIGHVARPITELKDPSSFAPPPRRTGSGLIPPPPREKTSRRVVESPSKYQDPRAPVAEPAPHQLQIEYRQDEEEEDDRPPVPYRANTTGLSTDNLPPPPGRKDRADGRSPPPPPSYQSSVGGARPGPPSLPPRLPPRTNSSSPADISPVSTGNNYINQGAVNRLGAAGISVPGLGIGRSSPANTNPTSPPQPPRPGAGATQNHLSELQNRFSKFSASSSPAPAKPQGEGTTWAQKQAALKTASSFQKDPSSISFSDAKSAAGTANNFRQRHGEQVAAGMKSANGLNQKYGLMDKVGSYTGTHDQGQPGAGQRMSSPALSGLAGKKKPPPPPPKKKPGLAGAAVASGGNDEPPPVPLSTRPQF
ncbi:hypothetical protein G7046_g9274 [Stylonectria norvegica]|nr:hypothetical protein G7046_g9274 [Stylonectria norvegica]